VSNPQQFLDPNRTKELLHNGLVSLNTLLALDEANNPTLFMEKIRSSVQVRKDGPTLYTNIKGRSLVGVTFAADATMQFTTDETAADFFIIGPTYNPNKPFGQSGPSEGMRTAYKKIEFPTRAPEDQIQHGGILIDNNTGRFYVMNYSELIHAQQLPRFSQGYYCIEGNWYIDSTNYTQVLSRSNIDGQTRPYNCLGVFWDEHTAPRLFSISSYSTSIKWIKQHVTGRSSLMIGKNPTMAQIVGVAMIMSETVNLPNWRILGLEFNGGGTFNFYPYSMHHAGGFHITYPK
jgi:hypothetical protein